MSSPSEIYGDIHEGVDFYVVAAVSVPRAAFADPVLLTQGDVNGAITVSIFPPYSATAVYSTTFLKTAVQDGAGGTQAIHAALVDSRWGLDDIGHNFIHKIRETDVVAGTLKGGRTYTLVYSIPTVSDGNVKVVAHATIRPLHV